MIKLTLKKINSFAVIFALFICALQVSAEDFLIKNATVYTSSDKGVLENTDIYVSDGFIMQIGQNLTPGGKHKIIDATGKHVTPGLINASTHLGLVEIGAASSTVDYHTSNESLGASFSIAPAINFRSSLIPQSRMNGLTRAIVRPASNHSLFQGKGSAIALLSSQEGLIKEDVAQYAIYGVAGANVAGGSRGAAYALLDQALEEANFLRNNRSRYLAGYNWQFSQSVRDLDSLKDVLEKKVPLIVSAHRSDDILQMLKLAKKHEIRLVISGASEAWMVAEDLAKAEVPVIIDPILNLPGSFESLAIRLEGAAILSKAGVKLAFTGIDWQSTHNAYLVRQSAGNAVAYGMDAHEALKAMTINTAEIFGIKHYGQIAGH